MHVLQTIPLVRIFDVAKAHDFHLGCLGFRSITTGPSIQAMMRIAPPQAAQVSMSILNTRLGRCARVIEAWRSAGHRDDADALLDLFRRAVVALEQAAQAREQRLDVRREHARIEPLQQFAHR